MSDTSYAVLARAKAKYGKRLKDRDYKNLLDCESVAEVMTYLKSGTHYIEAFGEANERGIRRGLFENLLKQYMTNEFDTLSRYELSVGEDFSQYLAHKTEIDEITLILTLLNSADNRSERFNFTVPPHMAKQTSINLRALSEAQSFEEFLEAVKKTRYYAVLKDYTEPLPVSKIENRLYTMLYDELYESIKRSGLSDKKDLYEMFDAIVDYRNFLSIIRLKKYYNADPKQIAQHLIPHGTLSEKAVVAMCTAENADETFRIMCATRAGKLMSKLEYNDIGELTQRVKFAKARHIIYFSDSPAAVMMAYIALCETELYNLICIIEGKRYNIGKDRIEKLLIY